MFSGLVETVGTVAVVRPLGTAMDLGVDLGGLGVAPGIGDSIAISGCCCTVVRIVRGVAEFHLTEETLRRTWLGSAEVGRKVNLEDALRVGEPFGGHLVQGHVDGVGEVVRSVGLDGGEWRVRVPQGLLKYCVEKGSICVDGVSLTIAGIDGEVVSVAIIPHTACLTTLGGMEVGERVNLEVDVIAKYVERMLGGRR